MNDQPGTADETSNAVSRLFSTQTDVSPDLTVVIPTFNRRLQLRQLLVALDTQIRTPSVGNAFLFNVIVVSDGSTDGTRDMLDEFTPTAYELHLVEQDNAGPAAARNAGIAAATAPIVVFLDDDVVPEPGCLAAHLSAHRRRDNLVVVGPMLTPTNASLKPWIRWEQHQLEKQYRRLQDGGVLYARQFYTGNASARRAALVQAGLFDTSLKRAEDIEMGRRLEQLGESFQFIGDAEAYHFADRSFESWARVAYDYGHNDVSFSEDSATDLANIAGFFRERHPLQQRLIRALPPGTLRHDVGHRALSGAARLAAFARIHRLNRVLLSAVYGLHYYRGVADALGSSPAFQSLIANAEDLDMDAHSDPDAVTAWFVLEQTLGHITHGKNLRSLVPNVAGVTPVFIPVDFDMTERQRRIPGWENWTVRAGVRARRALFALRTSRSTRAPDVLFVHSQVPAVLLGRWLRRYPSVVSLDATPLQYDALGEFYNHEPGSGRIERIKTAMNRRCFENADHLVTWSNWAKDSLIADYGVPASHITVISPGVDIDRWRRPDDGIHDSAPLRVLFVGGNLARKGGTTLLDATRRLRNDPDVPPFELHLVTPEAVESEPGVVVHNNLSANSPELIAQYHQADIFCLPTFGDCLPMVLAEAGAAGLPLISTNVAAIPSIVRHDETGLLIEPGDVEALTEALRQLLSDDAHRVRLAKGARALAERDHNAAANAAKIVDILRSVRASVHR